MGELVSSLTRLSLSLSQLGPETGCGSEPCGVASRAEVGKPKRRAEIRGNSRSCRISPTEPELRFSATSSGSPSSLFRAQSNRSDKVELIGALGIGESNLVTWKTWRVPCQWPVPH